MKAVFASDGTKKTGNIIISYLLRDNGVNYYNHKGDDPNGFYYIDKYNVINCVSDKKLILNGDYQMYDIPAIKGYYPPYELYCGKVKTTDRFIMEHPDSLANVYRMCFEDRISKDENLIFLIAPAEWVEAEWTPAF